ncbi:MAG: hypothetical protein ACLPJH_05565 [Myxococcaceae bacterium]
MTVTSKGLVVVRLPRARVEEPVARGGGAPPAWMKQWVVGGGTAGRRGFAREASAFVGR